MNSKRRADLQRKLSLKAVPRPPAGLVDRIKADIPKYLEADDERGRYSRTVAFHMRVAASIVLLVTSLVVAVYLVDTPTQEKAATAAPGPFAPASRSLVAPATATAAPQEAKFDVAEDAAIEVPQIAMAAPPPAPRRMRPSDAPAIRAMESSAEGGVVGGMAGGAAPPAEAQAVIAQDFGAPAPAPVPPPVAIEAAPARALPLADNRAEKASAAPAPEVFGISIDPRNFHEIRQTLESGGRPAASAVDVEALVNYFAGPPARRPRRGVRLEVEASPAAVEAEGDHAILRFSIDTPAGNAPVASNVRLEVDINEEVVVSYKRIGGGAQLPAEAVLPNGTSVTGLYALELRPPLMPKQLVAKVRLHYTINGDEKTLVRDVYARDLARSWQRASRRHRLASLGAVWGETLRGEMPKGTAPAFDVARRAEELATQDPKDARAKELAAAASASAGGGR